MSTEPEIDAGPVGVWEGLRWHMHAEPVCAVPECRTHLTPTQMTEMRARGYSDIAPRPTPVIPPEGGAS